MRQPLYLGVTLLGIILMSACITPAYRLSKVENLKSDTILYVKKDDDWIKEPITISCSGAKVGSIILQNERDKPVRLVFNSISGKKIKLWRMYDYSDITKITQSPDGRRIRIYHWHILLLNRSYVTELDLDTLKVKGYRLSRKATEALSY